MRGDLFADLTARGIPARSEKRGEMMEFLNRMRMYLIEVLRGVPAERHEMQWRSLCAALEARRESDAVNDGLAKRVRELESVLERSGYDA